MSIKVTIPIKDVKLTAYKAKKGLQNRVYVKQAPLGLLPVLSNLNIDLRALKDAIKTSNEKPIVLQVWNQDLEVQIDNEDNLVVTLLNK